MPAARRQTRRANPAAWCAAGFSLLLAASVLYAAVPRLVSSALLLPLKPILEITQEAADPGPERRRRLATAQAGALRHADDPAVRREAATNAIELARLVPREAAAERRAAFEHARDLAAGAVARTPLDSSGWYELARAEYYLDRHRQSARALAQSFRAEPRARQLYISRIDLAMRVWRYLPLANRQHVLRDMRAAWHTEPHALCKLASSRFREGLLLSAFAPDPLEMIEVQKFIWTVYPDRRPRPVTPPNPA